MYGMREIIDCYQYLSWNVVSKKLNRFVEIPEKSPNCWIEPASLIVRAIGITVNT